MTSDLHVHTNFCDGKNTPEEMVLSAIDKGVQELGLVCHAPVPFSCDWCIKREQVKTFQNEVNRLKEKYQDKIKVLCGVELDYFSNIDQNGFDFAIGSVHFFHKDGKFCSVDDSEEDFKRSVNTMFNGDVYLAVENYFETLSEYYHKFKIDIIGHFDLIRKFNKGGKLFDESHPRYQKAMLSAIDKLIKLGVPFEINTGAIARGYQDEPYPSKTAIETIKSKGGKLIITSDSHCVEKIVYDFSKWSHLVDA